MVGAVLFAKDLRKVSTFYVRVFQANLKHADAEHAELDIAGFRLIVQQIPAQFIQGLVISDPPRRREHGAVRLDFIVDDISRSRSDARSLGGVIDDQPPPWAGGDIRFYLGHDPEGNVFGTTIA